MMERKTKQKQKQKGKTKDGWVGGMIPVGCVDSSEDQITNVDSELCGYTIKAQITLDVKKASLFELWGTGIQPNYRWNAWLQVKEDIAGPGRSCSA
jgi:hypothetical protein